MAAPMTNLCRQNLTVFQSCFSQFRIIYRSQRKYSFKDLKKFYKQATITQNDGLYEINLDKTKLKTPMGNLFQVPNEALALAVATEWNAQDKLIKRHNMHLTSLCNTAIDNPSQRSHDNIANGIIHFLQTDTVCYRVDTPVELTDLQTKLWNPLIHWFTDRYGVSVKPTTGLSSPDITPQTASILQLHLLSYGDWALYGFQAGVETLKSLIIMLAVVDKEISVETAVYMSRLEQEFQIQHWGVVEWAHDLDKHETTARLAAAALFIHWSSESSSTKHKLKQQNDSVQ